MRELGAAGAVPAGLGVVEGGALPYQPEALAKKQRELREPAEARSRDQVLPAGRAARDLHAVPVSDHPEPEAHHDRSRVSRARCARSTWTNQIEAPADSWMGWSNGRWEGETLVVDTKGFNDLSWFDRAGNFHSDALHVVERFTPRSADTLNYEVTIEDPKVFTRPWKMSMPLYRRVEPNAQILEFRCVEFVGRSALRTSAEAAEQVEPVKWRVR